MTYKDPTQQLLKAYVDLLEGQITYNGSTITVGTRIPRKTKNYILLYLDALNNYDTGDKVLYNASMAIEVVSIQEISEGNMEIANSILDSVLQLIDSASLSMNDFTCLTAVFESLETNTEMTEVNYIITKKLRMNHFIEQNN